LGHVEQELMPVAMAYALAERNAVGAGSTSSEVLEITDPLRVDVRDLVAQLRGQSI